MKSSCVSGDNCFHLHKRGDPHTERTFSAIGRARMTLMLGRPIKLSFSPNFSSVITGEYRDGTLEPASLFLL